MEQSVLHMQQSPKCEVTVFLTSYNHEKFIAQSIESILHQTFTEFELIVVDDCSIDSSWHIIQEYCKHDFRIKAFRNEKNEGDRYYSRTIKQIKTKYLAIAHSDDLWVTDKLEKQFNFLESFSEFQACFTWVSFINDNGETLSDEESGYGSPFTVNYKSRFELLHHFFKIGNCLCHPSLMIRRSAFDEFSLYAFGLEALPDFCKWIRLALSAEIHIIEERLTYFRVHTDRSNTSARNLPNLNAFFIENFFMLNEFLKISGEDLLRAFPEARELIPSHSNASKLPDALQNGQFLFAQLCLQDPRFLFRLFGLNIIYQLLNNDYSRVEIHELYGYDETPFSKDKQKSNVFVEIHPEQFLRCDLYYKTSSDSKDIKKLSKNSFIDDDNFIFVRYEFDKAERNIEDLRFKPESRTFWQYKISEVRTNSGNNEAFCCGSPFSSDNGDLFYDDCPCYTIENDRELSWVEISFFAKPASTNDLSAFLKEGYQVLALFNGRIWKTLVFIRGMKTRLLALFKKKERK